MGGERVELIEPFGCIAVAISCPKIDLKKLHVQDFMSKDCGHGDLFRKRGTWMLTPLETGIH